MIWYNGNDMMFPEAETDQKSSAKMLDLNKDIYDLTRYVNKMICVVGWIGPASPGAYMCELGCKLNKFRSLMLPLCVDNAELMMHTDNVHFAATDQNKTLPSNMSIDGMTSTNSARMMLHPGGSDRRTGQKTSWHLAPDTDTNTGRYASIATEHTRADGSAPSTDISVAAEPATAPDITSAHRSAEVEPIVSAVSGATVAIADCIAWAVAQSMDAPTRALDKLTEDVLEHRDPMSPKDETVLTKIAHLILSYTGRTRKSLTRLVECSRWRDATRQRALNDKGLATEQASDEPIDNEVRSEDEVIRCLTDWPVKWMRRELDATQHELHEFRVKYRKDDLAYLTHFQRSFMNNILRNRLGSKFVAMRIRTVDLPQIYRAENIAASNLMARRRGPRRRCRSTTGARGVCRAPTCFFGSFCNKYLEAGVATCRSSKPPSRKA